MMTPAEMASLACLWEATARKPGNVHPGAAFRDLEYMDFVLSAQAIGQSFSATRGERLGLRIEQAVRATRTVVRTNTNLGIILLLAPLVSAAEQGSPREVLPRILRSTDVTDASHVYRAIRVANPGGLGESSEQDVHAEPTVTLTEAMILAAERDLIARQYATDYVDVFTVGLPAIEEASKIIDSIEAVVIHAYLTGLVSRPDTLIERKCGSQTAREAQQYAQEILARGGLTTSEGRAAGVAFDRWLRADGHRRNPGATADWVTACLFTSLLDNTLTVPASFRWPVTDWL